MQRLIFKSKIHRATLTGKSLEYEGSIAVDKTLLKLADILPGEQVHVLNLNNGVRLITYAIPAPAGSGTMLLNGPAARLGEPGDLIVLLTYTWMATAEAKRYKPTVIRVDAKNKPLPKTALKKKERP
jgi:aspartate 1-decarboxylase